VGRSDLKPYGVDSNNLALEHARQLLTHYAGNFVHGDIFDLESWADRTRHYELALLMLGRLQEVPAESAMKLLKHLQVSCSRVLTYVYPDWGEESLEAIARRFGLGLVESDYRSVAFLK
jgi:hypothetical protein